MAKAVAVANEQNVNIERLKSGPERLKSFLLDVRNELKKLYTPTMPEVRATTAVVLITVFIFAAYFAGVDYIISHSVGALLDKLSAH